MIFKDHTITSTPNLPSIYLSNVHTPYQITPFSKCHQITPFSKCHYDLLSCLLANTSITFQKLLTKIKCYLEPVTILGLFVLTSMHIWIQIWQWKFEFHNFMKKVGKIWPVHLYSTTAWIWFKIMQKHQISSIHTFDIFHARILRVKYLHLTLLFQHSCGYLKNHRPNCGLVCPHFRTLSMLNLNITMKIWLPQFLKKKKVSEISTWHLPSLVQRRLTPSACHHALIKPTPLWLIWRLSSYLSAHVGARHYTKGIWRWLLHPLLGMQNI